jgi:hypothetical protein
MHLRQAGDEDAQERALPERSAGYAATFTVAEGREFDAILDRGSAAARGRMWA